MKSAIPAAQADSVHVKNGKVGVLGGSAGGSHASFVLFDKIPTPGGGYPYWCLTGDNRPVCGVCLSGAYNFADRTFPDITPKFIKDVNNYTNTCVQADHLTKNGVAISPIALVKSAEQTFLDVFLVKQRRRLDALPPDPRYSVYVPGKGYPDHEIQGGYDSDDESLVSTLEGR